MFFTHITQSFLNRFYRYLYHSVGNFTNHLLQQSILLINNIAHIDFAFAVLRYVEYQHGKTISMSENYRVFCHRKILYTVD